jgi:hypothetical protein
LQDAARSAASNIETPAAASQIVESWSCRQQQRRQQHQQQQRNDQMLQSAFKQVKASESNSIQDQLLFRSEYISIMTVKYAQALGIFTDGVEAPAKSRAKYYEKERNRFLIFSGIKTLKATDLLRDPSFCSTDPAKDLVIIVNEAFRERALDVYARKKEWDEFTKAILTARHYMSVFSGTIFVACKTGRTRSATVIVAYLVLEYNMELVIAKRLLNAALEHRNTGAVDMTVDRDNNYSIAIRALSLGVVEFKDMKALRLGEDNRAIPHAAMVNPTFKERMEMNETQEDVLGLDGGNLLSVSRDGGMRLQLLKLADPITFSDEKDHEGTCTLSCAHELARAHANTRIHNTYTHTYTHYTVTGTHTHELLT